MADDQIYNYVQDFINNRITGVAFWELAKFRRPTHQISFHTLSAIDTLIVRFAARQSRRPAAGALKARLKIIPTKRNAHLAENIFKHALV